jgi:ABC-2 type transport system ATP-binding protein
MLPLMVQPIEMPPVIRTQGLTKFYAKARGIEDVTLDVRPGEIFGFLGPNGAGKTTTIRILADMIRPTRGRAEVFGMDARAEGPAIRARLGYLPGELHLYEHMTGRDHLRYLGNLRGGYDAGEVERMAGLLEADLSRKIEDLSKGNKQKVGLIQALMNRPQLLVLDEPTGGLDPLMQHQVHRLIGEARDEGRTVFLSSHLLPEVEALCDRVGIIREGRLIAVEQIAELKARALRRLEIHFAGPAPVEEFAGLSEVRDVAARDGVLTCAVVGELDTVVKTAARHRVVNIVSHEPSLEEIFLAYYEGDRAP